jgi:hypothetical protein
MTKRERLRIYKKAYEAVCEIEYEFMCHAIEKNYQGMFRLIPSAKKWEEKFPEFYLMSPNDNILDERGEWFNISERKTREIILAFCIEMCQTAKT